MGNLKQEGDAINVVAPNGEAIVFGEVYRIDGWTGIAMTTIASDATERGLALEVSNRIWYVTVPAGVAAARGALLYWSTGAGFKRGSTDLAAAAGVGPVAKVEEAKDGNNVVGLRVINSAS